MAEAWPETDQESQLRGVFSDLEKAIKKLDKTKDAEKLHALLKTITAKLKNAKVLIKEFEREARTDGMPAAELADRRRTHVARLNGFIEAKKAFGQKDETRAELMGENPIAAEEDVKGLSMVQLVNRGRKELDGIDKTLGRAERLANETEAIGIATAATLGDQTKQLEKVVDGLNEIEFNMKKATKVIRDITRGMLTDKCIMFLMFCVAAGVTALIIIKIIKPNKKSLTTAITNSTEYNNTLDQLWQLGQQVKGIATNITAGRRMLHGAAQDNRRHRSIYLATFEP